MMLIDGRGIDFSEPYERLKALITTDACTLDDTIEVWVDQEISAKKMNVLVALVGYNAVIEQRGEHWILRIDGSHRRCP